MRKNEDKERRENASTNQERSDDDLGELRKKGMDDFMGLPERDCSRIPWRKRPENRERYFETVRKYNERNREMIRKKITERENVEHQRKKRKRLQDRNGKDDQVLKKGFVIIQGSTTKPKKKRSDRHDVARILGNLQRVYERSS